MEVEKAYVVEEFQNDWSIVLGLGFNMVVVIKLKRWGGRSKESGERFHDPL